MGYMKQSFENWIRTTPRDNGTPYSAETISGYVSSLRSHAEKLSDIELENTDLFTVDDLSSFDKICKQIRESADYEQINRAYHRIFSSALAMYRKFLIAISATEDDMTEKFEEWLRRYPDHKYTEGTIKRYIRALQKAEEWLGTSLPKQILNIGNLNEFSETEKVVKAHPDFEEINLSHGHGDLSAAMNAYKKFLLSGGTEAVPEDDWWPPLSEYDPGITKERWLKILNNPDIIGPVWGGVLAKFYTHKEGATCKEIANEFGDTPSSVIATCMNLGKCIHKETGCPIDTRENGQNRYWTIMFRGKDAAKEQPGVYIWKLRPELYEALTEFDILRFLPKRGPRVMSVSTKDAIRQIKDYIAARGFSYDNKLIENFYLSLKTKPFVILAGTSGTGKTRLVKLFAEAIGAEYYLVPVSPDWSDGSDLFGHKDLNGGFHDGPVCECFEKAKCNPDTPVFLCLDEMNLARVEYYFSDFLSVIESREKLADGTIKTSKIKQYENGIPDNLYIVGTVNMDETTFPFSKKVLDRANTIEFNYVDLLPDFTTVGAEVDSLQLPNSFLRTEYLVLTRDCAGDQEDVVRICDKLQQINQILLKANAHVGYRVRDEIVFYMLNNKNNGELLEENEALDNEIMQKILPRIQGSSASVRDMLCELFRICASDPKNKTGETDSEKMHKILEDERDKCLYRKSAEKLELMVRRFEEDGFTSYWQ